MKRVKAGCIFQTLIFMQKEDAGFTKDEALKLNREEVERYKKSLSTVRHRITAETELENGSILVYVRKQYNDTADVEEYFALN